MLCPPENGPMLVLQRGDGDGKPQCLLGTEGCTISLLCTKMHSARLLAAMYNLQGKVRIPQLPAAASSVDCWLALRCCCWFRLFWLPSDCTFEWMYLWKLFCVELSWTQSASSVSGLLLSHQIWVQLLWCTSINKYSPSYMSAMSTERACMSSEDNAFILLPTWQWRFVRHLQLFMDLGFNLFLIQIPVGG